MVNYSYRKLQGRIKEMIGTQADFAKKIGVSRVHVSEIFNNKAQFTQELIDKTINVLDIKEKDVFSYFFTK